MKKAMMLGVVLLICTLVLIFVKKQASAPQETETAPNTTDISHTVRHMTESELHAGTLMLVNAENGCASSKTVLTSVYAGKTDSYLVKDASLSVAPDVLSALNDWMDASFSQNGVSNINIVAGFRSDEEQRCLYDNALQTKGQAYADKYFMLPGFSEHHTGLAIDLALYDVETGTSADFTGTGVYAWTAEHACDYGFIQRYPDSKSAITGIDFESWHYRYVGIPHACYMYRNGLCLEEYLELLKRYPYAGEHLLFSCNGIHYEIWYCEGLDVTVPTDASYELSGNNDDGFIVTVTQP